MGDFGFSYIGLLFILMLTIPNLIWTKHQPIGYTLVDENKLLVFFERVGQIGVTGISLCFTNLNINNWSLWIIWLLMAFLLMIMYECWWYRYFKSEKKLSDFYSSFCGFPYAGATLPVIAFFFLSIYGKMPLLTVFVILLGIGHIGIHIQHGNKNI